MANQAAMLQPTLLRKTKDLPAVGGLSHWQKKLQRGTQCNTAWLLLFNCWLVQPLPQLSWSASTAGPEAVPLRRLHAAQAFHNLATSRPPVFSDLAQMKPSKTEIAEAISAVDAGCRDRALCKHGTWHSGGRRNRSAHEGT